MTTKALFVFAGIDEHVVINDARRKSKESALTVHYHRSTEPHIGARHRTFDKGEEVGDWISTGNANG